MIQRIDKIQNFGIFRNYISDPNISDFARYNLLYGWNGSGKSTLSKLFYFLSLNKLSDDFSNSVFSLTTNNGTINSTDIENISLSIQVFNEQFIKENIEWDKLVKSLLYVSKGKIEEKKNLDALREELIDVNRKIDRISKEIQNIKNNNESFLTDSAREIKKQFEVLRTDDNYYINYDKRKLKKLIQSNPKLKYKRPIVSEKNIEKLKIISRLEFLEELHLNIPNKINFVEFDSIIKEVNEIIKEDIVSESIKQLKNNPVISSWVEIGLEIHNGLKKCKFCGNPLSEKRINRLKKHFNENYILLKDKIKSIITKVENLKQEPDILPTELELYPFLKESFYKEINLIRNNYEKINKIIDKVVNNLDSKYQNPFNTKFTTIRTPTKIISGVNKNIDNLRNLVGKHNEITESFEQKVSEAKKHLELYYAHKQLKAFNYFNKLQDVEKKEKQITILGQQIPKLESSIKKLEATLTDEILGAEEFNNKLHRFLNHRDISLKFDKVEKGYEIIRRNGKKSEKATNLSEGEKSAISFIFFLTKLKENDEKLRDTIVVIDDPISSFDSNHLFNAYSFIRNSLNDSVSQLFILTHNFSFFKLLRDWLQKKNKRNKPVKSRFYSIQADYKKGIREAKILNADDTLMNYNSEYHFLFQKIYEYKSKSALTLDDCFIISNISRKFLEIFLSFKFPKKRNDFYTLLNDSLPNKNYSIMKDRVYKFINQYSHGDKIESFDATTDNISSESKYIIEDLLRIVKRIDKKHYEELIEIIKTG